MNMTFIRGWTKRSLKSGRMNGRLLLVMFLLLFFVDFLIHPNISPHIEICGGLLLGILGGVASGAMSALTSAGGQALNNAFFGSPMSQQKELMDYQYEKQKEFVDYQNDYNTPANQLDRFEQAGVNPNLAMNFGLGSAGNSQYSMPNPNQFRTSADFQNLMEDSFYKQNQAQLAEAMSKSEDTFRDSKLEQLMIQNKHEQIVSAIDAMEKEYKQEFGRTKYKAEINKDVQGALALHYQAYKAAMEGDVESVEAMFKYQDKLYDLGMKHLGYQFESSTLQDRIKQVQQMLKNLAEQQKEIKARTNASNASAYESREHAGLYHEQAITEDKFRDDLGKINHYNARLLERQNWKDNYTMGQQLQEYFNLVERSGLINEQMRQDIQMAITRNDFEAAHQAVSIISEATSGLSNLYGMKLGQQTADAKSEIARKWNDYSADRKKVIGFGQ